MQSFIFCLSWQKLGKKFQFYFWILPNLHCTDLELTLVGQKWSDLRSKWGFQNFAANSRHFWVGATSKNYVRDISSRWSTSPQGFLHCSLFLLCLLLWTIRHFLGINMAALIEFWATFTNCFRSSSYRCASFVFSLFSYADILMLRIFGNTSALFGIDTDVLGWRWDPTYFFIAF